MWLKNRATVGKTATNKESGMREFLERPLVQIALGALLLLLAVRSFVSGGIDGLIIGLLLVFVGGRSGWRGFTKWQAERS